MTRQLPDLVPLVTCLSTTITSSSSKNGRHIIMLARNPWRNLPELPQSRCMLHVSTDPNHREPPPTQPRIAGPSRAEGSGRAQPHRTESSPALDHRCAFALRLCPTRRPTISRSAESTPSRWYLSAELWARTVRVLSHSSAGCQDFAITGCVCGELSTLRRMQQQ